MVAITMKQWFAISSGFAFVVLTVSAIYVSSIGVEVGYRTPHNGKKLTDDIYAIGRGRKARPSRTGVGSASSKTPNKPPGRRVSSSVTKTNRTIGAPKQPEDPTSPKQGDAEGIYVKETASSQGLPKAANSSEPRTAFGPTMTPASAAVRDVEQSTPQTPDPLYNHHGYVYLLDPTKKLNLHCTQCAVVSSSGQLIHSGVGYLIDEADCIFRMNDAPVPTYEEDVGSRTTVRVVGHVATYNLRNKRRYLLQESSSQYVVGWGPALPMRTEGTGYAYNNLRELAKLYKKVNFLYLTQGQMRKADEVFEAETGVSRMKTGTYLSTGWFTMLLARDSCDEIHVYGMVDDKYCQSLTNKNVPYHYYDQFGKKECDYYRTHESGKKHSHRFMTEKAIFARWAMEQPPIFFHVPDWNP